MTIGAVVIVKYLKATDFDDSSVKLYNFERFAATKIKCATVSAFLSIL